MLTSHRIDIYGSTLFLATTKADWKKLAKKTGLDTSRPEAAGQVSTLTWHPKKRGLTELHIAIWIDCKNHTNQSDLVDTLAHEASHAAGRILEHTGHEVPATDEPHAYLVGWITAWLWRNCGGGDASQ